MCGKILLILTVIFGAAVVGALLAFGTSSEATIAEPPVAAPSIGGCYFSWSTRDLPDIAEQVEALLETSGVEVLAVSVTASGDACTDPQTNEVLDFGTMQTDFHISAELDDLSEREVMGDTLATIIDVIAGFPLGTLEGSKPGYLNITFTDEANSTFLYLYRLDAEAARQQGLSGEALLTELGY